MFKLERILLPVDFSDRSHGASRYTDALVRRFNPEVTLLHVLTPPHIEFSSAEVGGAALDELLKYRAAQVEAEMGVFLRDELADAKVQRLVLEGDPARRIIELAHQLGMDLIVMPTHGYGRFRRLLLGSVTAKVLHDADCAVWTGVHLEDAPRVDMIDFRSIVVAVDLGPMSCQTLRWAAWFANEYGARLSLVHITPEVDGYVAEGIDPEWRSYFTRQARKEIDKLQDSLGTDAQVVIGHGDPARLVCEFARQLKADLLVIGRGVSSGVLGRLRASAYSIIRQSMCPVVSV